MSKPKTPSKSKLQEVSGLLPREKLLQKGVESLKDWELLAILLRTGLKDKNVLDLSKEIFQKYDLERFLTLTIEELKQIKGIETGKACTILAALELGKRVLQRPTPTLPRIEKTEDAVLQGAFLRQYKKEHLLALYLNGKNQVIHQEILAIGVLDSVLTHPREIFEPALRYLASQVILMHNHPQGDLEASSQDLQVTKQLMEAGKILGIELLDHIIITKEGFCSIMERLEKVERFCQ